MAFKEGDRVRVYGLRGHSPFVAKITGLDGRGNATVLSSVTGTIVVHTKQCRRLVKKERRRIWATENFLGKNDYVGALFSKDAPTLPDCSEIWVEFIEVIKKK